MNDPRIILKQELIKIGLADRDATLIALDAGGCQTLVEIEYLSDFQYSQKINNLILGLIHKFYSGELFANVEN